MTKEERESKAKVVAERARETFLRIRELRKNSKAFTRAQKDELEKQIVELQNQWWIDNKELFIRGPHPWDSQNYCPICKTYPPHWSEEQIAAHKKEMEEE